MNDSSSVAGRPIPSFPSVPTTLRLNEVLAFIQTQQEQDPPKARRAGKQRTRYEPTGRKPGGNNTLRDRRRRATEEALVTSMPAE